MAFYDGNGNILSNYSTYVNVADFGTFGNGISDDTKAIQAALDSLWNTGGTIFFPVGTYLLTGSIRFHSNQHLLFEKGARLLQGAGINNLMVNSGSTDVTEYNGTTNVTIEGAIFDGGLFEVNNTLLGFSHATHITVKDCTFINAYGAWHNLEINSSKNVLVTGCRFEGSRKTEDGGCLIQLDAAYGSTGFPWKNGAYDNTVCDGVEISNCYFCNCTVPPAIGNHSQHYNKNIRIHDNYFDTMTSERGAIRFYYAQNVDVYNNTFKDCAIGFSVDTLPKTCTAHDNRFIGVTTPVGNSMWGTGEDYGEIVSYNNMVDGVLSE